MKLERQRTPELNYFHKIPVLIGVFLRIILIESLIKHHNLSVMPI